MPKNTSNTEQSTSPRTWNLRDLKFPREELVDAVSNAAGVPEKWKDAIIDSIQNFDKHASLLRLDAHAQYVKTAKGSTQVLTISLSEL